MSMSMAEFVFTSVTATVTVTLSVSTYRLFDRRIATTTVTAAQTEFLTEASIAIR